MKGSLEQLKKALEPMGLVKTLGNQLKVNCPRCEGELGMEVDKFNLEVNYNKNMFHCWACNTSGNLHTLVKKYGVKEFASLFKTNLVDNFKDENSEVEEKPLELPKHAINVLNIPHAAKYLLNTRKIPKQKIRERNIKYCYDGEFKDCIIFPSYDSNNILNGFVSHNLTTKKYKKKKSKGIYLFLRIFY